MYVFIYLFIYVFMYVIFMYVFTYLLIYLFISGFWKIGQTSYKKVCFRKLLLKGTGVVPWGMTNVDFVCGNSWNLSHHSLILMKIDVFGIQQSTKKVHRPKCQFWVARKENKTTHSTYHTTHPTL